MATISLYASKINQMPGLLKASKKKVVAFQDELQNLNKKILKIDNSVCDVYNESGIVRASVNTQELLADSIGKFNEDLDEFISDTVDIDNNAAALINQNKKDFYEKYSYLKPECEKSTWEKVKGAFKKAGQWCKDHWKIIVTVVLVIAAIVVICVCPAAGLGLLAIGAAKGLLAGAVIGGIIGGISAKATGKGSFFEGFEDGAFSGAITGAIFGGIGGAGELAGQALGRSCDLIAKFGPAIKNVTLSANILNLGMAGFDLVSLGAMMIDPKCKLVQLNQMMHSSKLYNGVQLGLGAVGAFGAGMLKGIQFDLQNGISKCFVAGTMISTVSGLTAIENIRAGDIVLSADEKTGERGFKKVVETYVRETMKLVHLIVNGEEIVTTEGHPFYVKELGFVKAAELSEGDILTDSKGGEMPIEFIKTETTDSPVTVYNFQVEEYHTYFVSDTGILVHNADSSYISPSEQAKSWQGKGKYPGVDEYVDVTVNKGTVLYRGEPNGSEYFTTIDAIEKSGRNATKIFEGLQVEKHPIYGYRSEMKGYIFNQDIEAAYGITNANPQFGAGGLPQYFVPDVQTLIDNNILVPIDNISLTP